MKTNNYNEYKMLKYAYLNKKFGFRIANCTMSRHENETVHNGLYIVNNWRDGEREKHIFKGLSEAIFYMAIGQFKSI